MLLLLLLLMLLPLPPRPRVTLDQPPTISLPSCARQTLRIGHIGHIFPQDSVALLETLETVLEPEQAAAFVRTGD